LLFKVDSPTLSILAEAGNQLSRSLGRFVRQKSLAVVAQLVA
jgi:hypothetical protein